MKYLVIIFSMFIVGCGGGGSSSDGASNVETNVGTNDSSGSLSPDIHYEETVTIINADNPDEQHFTNTFHRVAQCMGYDAPVAPTIYVLEEFPESVSARALGTTSYYAEGQVTIAVHPETLTDYTLSHEFVHYIMFMDNDLSVYNVEHLATFFADCSFG